MPSLMESIISLDVGAQEPWPNDVQLFQPYSMEQILLPDNANCLATQAFLHMCGLPFKIEHRANAEFMSPSGKVPFIKCGAFVVSELEPIVQFVASKGISLTQDFDNEQKSDLRAYMSLIFSVLMNAELYICWCDKRTYNEVTKVRNGSVYPWPLNHYQNWTKRSAVIKKLKLLNWYQKTLGSVYQEVETCCQALSERLEGKEYFFGSKPTEVDALLYGHTYSIFSNPVDFPNLFVIFQRFPNLIIHCRRICFHYTFLRYIDFTKTDTDIDSRDSSTHNLVAKSEINLFTQFWNYITLNMYNNVPCVDVTNDGLPEFEYDDKKSVQITESVSQMTNNICFKKSGNTCIKFKTSFDESIEAPKSINYLGHKVIQQHLQQDLRNKLSDFTIDTNSDLWSEKDICYIISDSDLIRTNVVNVEDKEDDIFELDADNTKDNLETKYTRSNRAVSGSGSSSTNSSRSSNDISNIIDQLDWLHHSSTSTIEINFSNKCDNNSFANNPKNNTLNNDQENNEIDVDNKSNCNTSDLDWLTDYTSDTKVDHKNDNNNNNNNNKEIIKEIITFDSSNNEEMAAPIFTNCIDDDLDWLHDFTNDLNKKLSDDTLKQNGTINLENKSSETDVLINVNVEVNTDVEAKTHINADIDAELDFDLNLIKKCSTHSNSNAWTTVESVSDSGDNLDSTIELMNDMINSIEQMHIISSSYNNNNNNNNSVKISEENIIKNSISEITSELTIETYSENHICNDNCANIFVVNDDSFWDDDISKSISDNEKSIISDIDVKKSSIEMTKDMKILEKKHSVIKICCENVIDKISNESLKKYFSCESCKNVNLMKKTKSRSSVIEEYPVDKLSNVIIAVNQTYPENEFLKLLKSDNDISQYTNSESTDQNNSSSILQNNCNEFDEPNTNEQLNSSNNNNNNTNQTKPRIFRKCRRLLNRSVDPNNTAMRSDSKILQMYNEKIFEYRNKSNSDIENIRTACSVLKSFNTKPEQCKTCSLCKFSSNPSISHSCKCYDSNYNFKSKSVNKFS